MSNPAPAAVALLKQADAAFPGRLDTSDGIVPSKKHHAQNPRSDHEIGRAGYNHAADLSHDPSHGCDCGKITEAMRVARDRRIKYVIWQSAMFDGLTWVWRPYHGTPHTKHCHVSIVDNRSCCEDTSPWPGITATEEAEVVIVLQSPPAGWLRFWRLRNGNGDFLYTSNPNEVEASWKAGYDTEPVGVGFDISLTDPTNINDLIRLVKGGFHHYCLPPEARTLETQGWKIEGRVAKVGTHGVQVARLVYSPAHLFTINPTEVAAAVKAGWKPEGVAFGCGVVVAGSEADKKLAQIDSIIHG